MYFNLNIGSGWGFLLVVVLYVAYSSIFGVATNIVLKNRGYRSANWFWWGFFFRFIAMIVALSKPENYEPVMDEGEYSKSVLKSGGWECSFCNTVNDNSVTSCSCGRNRDESEQHIKELERMENAHTSENNRAFINNEIEILELIEKYKKLLEAGAITQEEFDNKKNSLLNS